MKDVSEIVTALNKQNVDFKLTDGVGSVDNHVLTRATKDLATSPATVKCVIHQYESSAKPGSKRKQEQVYVYAVAMYQDCG